MDVPVLAYHKISNKLEWGITVVPVRAFAYQMRFLFNHGYQSISLAQYLTLPYSDDARKRRFVLTFDDADESVWLNAYPILKAYHFTATVFVISSYVGQKSSWDANLGGIYSKHLNWQQLLELQAAGWEIGSHSATHPDLVRLSDGELRTELETSKAVLEEKLGHPVHFLAYPFNRADERVISMASALKYHGGCSMISSPQLRIKWPTFCIQRHGVYAIDTPASFCRKLRQSSIERLKQQAISFAARGTIWYQQFRNKKNILHFK
ncbi:MAG: polysaccharide deacetylase family protein [candidate division KSB1 bacterium]|nr:polysaccharide deacetylase family protein [candidate division KSB1 bacterium]MDZ7318966.1 polysaccharide deacetylase family protein [candidate division KSB1 bacterium]MDZ7340572.1 polysaccharide deacetylase family protein [candidate division KSB1 bacterium]